jgi:hypothetical protein
MNMMMISTNYFEKKILKQEIESRFWLFKEYEETVDHLTSGCPNLAKNECIIYDMIKYVHICIT